jgi:hypothetical protein
MTLIYPSLPPLMCRGKQPPALIRQHNKLDSPEPMGIAICLMRNNGIVTQITSSLPTCLQPPILHALEETPTTTATSPIKRGEEAGYINRVLCHTQCPAIITPQAKILGSKFWRNSGSGPFSGIFGRGVAGIIF